MHLTPVKPINPKAIAACSVVWCASYVAPIYLLPVTLFLNLWLAVLVWGFVLSSAHKAHWPSTTPKMPVALPTLAIVVLAVCAGLQDDWVSCSVLSAAAAVLVFGALAPDGGDWMLALQKGLIVAGVLSVVVAGIQLIAPAMEIPGVAPSPTFGRSAGNLRQPNLLAQLFLQAIIATMAIQSANVSIRDRTAIGLAILFGAGISLTQSRTGWLGVGLLVAWSLLDRRLIPRVRRLPWATLGGCVLGLAFVFAVSSQSEIVPYAAKRAASPDLSSSRFAIWSNTLELIYNQPVSGVGWGQFARAWALTPFPTRPTASFDNAHSLPLQLAVELGIPLALFVMFAVGWAFWRAARKVHQWSDNRERTNSACTVAAISILLMHSLLEYPLWFSFFLLPFAFCFGRLIRVSEAGAAKPTPSLASSTAIDVLLKAAGIAIVVGCFYSAWDYSRVLQVFSPFGVGKWLPLEERIESGRRAPWFGPWVDFGVVTNAESFEKLDLEVQTAFRHRVNPRMLMIYATHLHERGEDDKAAYVAARLKEFRYPEAAAFFLPCTANEDSEKRSFQCRPPSRTYDWRDFK